MTNRSLTLFFSFLLLLAPMLSATAQDFPMLHYTFDDGLPSNTVYQVYRDSKGFLWIATDKGVARYNGVKFEKFTTFDGLADNEVFFFQEDYEGRLWLATYNGRLCFYKDGVFYNDLNTPLLKLPFKTSYVMTIDVQTDSSLTFNFYDPNIIVTIKGDSKKIKQFENLRAKLHAGNVIAKVKTSPERYEITCDSSEFAMDANFNITGSKKIQAGKYAGRTFSQNNMYFYSRDYLYSKDKKVIRALPPGFFDANFIHVYYRDGMTDFICTNNGLFINDSIHILRDNNVAGMTQDNKGDYWIGTLDNGLYCLKKDFLNTRILKNAYEGIAKYCFADSSRLLFAVSNNDLMSFDHGAVSCVFDYKKYKRSSYTIPGDAGYLIEKTGNDYNYYNYYNSDNIVIQHLFSPQRKIFTHFNYFLPLNIKAVFLADSLVYFKGRDRILLSENPLWKQHDRITHTYISDTIGSRIFGAAQSATNALFYSTINSVFKIDHEVNSVQSQFGKLTFKVIGIYDKYLLGITHDNKLMVCNNFEGNIRIDSVNNQYCIWQKLYKIDASHVLISTSNFYRLIELNPSDGAPNYSISTIESPFLPLNADNVCSDGNDCYFFKGGSITVIKVTSLLELPSAPEVFFLSLKTGKRSYSIDSVVSLSYRESKNIAILFSTLSFRGKDLRYQYSFSKNDQDNWRDLKGEEIDLINSAYGTYTIKLRAKTISSEYCTPVHFILHIDKPYWATWWFMILATCVFSLLVAIVTRFWIRSAMLKREKEHAAEMRFLRAEFKSLNALMNPHFIFNTLNNVQSLFNGNEKLAANEFLRIFADLIRQNMHNISKELISLQKEIDLVRNYLALEKLRFEDHLNYTINVGPETDISDIMIPPLLIQPLVENSLIHGILPKGGDGVIEINIFERGHMLYIEVRDNGMGMGHGKVATGTGHESFGIESIKKRIEQLGIIQGKKIEFHISDARDEAGGLQWTIVTISIPI